MKRFLLGTLVLVSWLLGSAQAKEVQVSVVFTGGMKGHILEDGQKPGLAKLYTLVKQLSAKAQEQKAGFLALDSGNTVAPFYLSRFDRGKLLLQTFAALGYVAISPGNYEFSYGKEYYRERLKGQPLFLAANIYEGKKRLGKPFLLLERQGIKIAIIGLTSPSVQERVPAAILKGWTLKSPVEEAAKVVKELQGKAQIIICVGFLSSSEAAELAEKVPQIHLIVRNYRQNVRQHGKWAVTFTDQTSPVVLSPHPLQVGRATLLVDAAKKPALRAVEVEYFSPQKAAADSKIAKAVKDLEGALAERFGRELLPFPPSQAFPVDFSREEFAKLLAYTLRTVLNTEVGIVNVKVLREKVLKELATKGKMEYLDLEKLFFAHTRVCVVALKGSALAEIVNSPSSREPLAFAGLEKKDGKVLVNGVPVRSGDVYWVATVQYLASGNTGYKAFQKKVKMVRTFSVGKDFSISPWAKGVELSLSETFTAYLRRTMADLEGSPYANFFRSQVKEMLEYVPPTYILWFDNLRLTYSQTNVSVSSTLAGSVTDTRASARDEETLGIGGAMHFIRLTSELLWENKASFIFAQSKIEGQPRNTSQDDLYFTSGLSFLSLGFPLWTFQMVPYMDLKYDTEFEKDQGKSTESILYFSLGAAGISPGPFTKLKFGALGKADFTGGKNTVQYGLLGQIEFHRSFWESVKVDSGLLVYYFPNQSEDKAGDLRVRLEWNTLIRVPVWREFFLVIEIRYFLFQAKKVGTNEYGNHMVVSVGISYNRIWKFLYEPLFGG